MRAWVLLTVGALAFAAPAAAQNDGLVRDERVMIYFNANTSELTDTAKRVVKMVVERYAANDRAIFYLSGHTDTLRLASVNLVLSASMANSVASYMGELGVPESQITRAAFGESSLAKATEDGVSEPLNRRVVINVYLPKEE